jgi:hypothetical protein
MIYGGAADHQNSSKKEGKSEKKGHFGGYHF